MSESWGRKLTGLLGLGFEIRMLLTPEYTDCQKIHKETIPLRPIVSFVGCPTYEVSKFISRILSPIVGNTTSLVKYSKEFMETITNERVQITETMVSFDVKSLLKFVPMELEVSIARDQLRVDGRLKDRTKLTVDDICEGLILCLNDTNFTFRGQHYQQIFGTAMGSPVSVVVANMVMEDIEQKAIRSFRNPLRICKRYVDDTFVITDQKEVGYFLHHINNLEESIKFTMEMEDNGKIAFLDALIHRDEGGVLTSTVHRKETHTNRYLHFKSNHPIAHKRSVVSSLLDRANKLNSHSKDRKKEVELIKKHC